MSADIIYSIATGRLRRVVTPSSNLVKHSGEGQLAVSTAQYNSFAGLDDIQAFVNALTGLTPSDDRYVSVDASYNVLSAHIADPACGDVAPQTGSSLFVVQAIANAGDLLWDGANVLRNKPLSASVRHRNQPLP